jgi:hypothetical protein
MTAGPPAGDVSRLLAGQIRALCGELLRDGRQEGAEWSARCPWRADHQAGSFKVRLSGPRAGVWADFATGERGDALDLVAKILFRGEKKPAIEWAAGWLGLGASAAPQPPR